MRNLQGVSLVALPQTLTLSGPGEPILASWGINTLNLTAADSVRLAPNTPQLQLQQPLLLVAGNISVTGVAPSGSSTGRHLMQQQQQQQRLQLRCVGNTTSAIVIR